MFKIQYILLLLTFSYLNSVQSTCNYADTVCTTLASRHIYRYVLSGVEGLFEPSDPLYLPEVETAAANLKYELSNATLTGLRSCEVLHTILHPEEESYEYHMECSNLVLTENYKRKTNSDPLQINQNGFVTLSLNNYEMVAQGKYGEQVREEDSEPYFFLKSFYSTFKAKGEVTIDIDGSLYSNKEKPESAEVTKYLKKIQKHLCIPTMEKFMEIIMKKYDLFMRSYPADVILPEDYSNFSFIETPVKF